MSSRHQPEAGADSEPRADTYDRTCDQCLRVIYAGNLHTAEKTGRVWLICDRCKVANDERYAAMVAAEDSEESRWKGVA